MANIVPMNLIDSLPLFAEINESERAILLKVIIIRKVARGEVLFLQGDPMLYFCIVCSGTLQSFRETADGHEITPEILTSGDSICLSEIMNKNPLYVTNIRAVEDSEIMEIPIKWLKQNLKNLDHLMTKFFMDVSRKLQETTLELERQVTMSAPQLITCFLYELLHRHNYNPESFELPYSKTLIASRLGMELETFSRSLHKLKDYGVTVQGTHVCFHDLQLTEKFICEHYSEEVMNVLNGKKKENIEKEQKSDTKKEFQQA